MTTENHQTIPVAAGAAGTEEEEEELVRMRGGANRLSACLDSLMRRIEQLEEQRLLAAAATAANENNNNIGDNIGSGTQSPTNNGMLWLTGGGGGGSTGRTTARKQQQQKAAIEEAAGQKREYISMDPLSGQRRLVTVVERPLPSGPLRAQSPTLLNGAAEQQSGWAIAGGGIGKRLLASAYESRIVEVPTALLQQADGGGGLELDQICGQLVALKVSPELSSLVRPGDTLLELDGQPLHSPKQLDHPKGSAVQLKLVLSDLYSAPMEFCRVLDDYQANVPQSPTTAVFAAGVSNEQQQKQQQHQPLLPYLSFPLQRGDILQVLSRDAQYFQARKVNDLFTAGFVPNSVRTRPVAMLNPYGRRVIALLGANGVGRRTLKRMLCEHRPHQFASVVPVTSRAPRAGEQQGREYQFLRKEDILCQIRDHQMVEWGEYNGQLYGTTADSVRQVCRSGRVCVLDCSLRAVQCLYNSEFMPFVVVVAAPPLEEMVQLHQLHAGYTQPTCSDQELRHICEQSDRLLAESEWAKQADLVLVNRNRDISLRRLLDALEACKSEPQWIPLEWLHGPGAAAGPEWPTQQP